MNTANDEEKSLDELVRQLSQQIKKNPEWIQQATATAAAAAATAPNQKNRKIENIIGENLPPAFGKENKPNSENDSDRKLNDNN